MAQVDPRRLSSLLQFAQQNGLRVTSGEHFDAHGNPIVPHGGHAGHSDHYSGHAIDVGIPDADAQSAILDAARQQGFTVFQEDYKGQGRYGYSTGPHWHIQFSQPWEGNVPLSPIQQMAVDTANRYGIPPAKFLGLIQVESNFDPKAVNPKSGAMGLGQFMPATAKGRGLDNPFDPQANLNSSAAYLRDLYQKTGSWDAALAEYGGFGGSVGKAQGYIGKNTLAEKAWGQRLGTSPGVELDQGQASAPPPSSPFSYVLTGYKPDGMHLFDFMNPTTSPGASQTTAPQGKSLADFMPAGVPFGNNGGGSAGAVGPGPNGIGSQPAAAGGDAAPAGRTLASFMRPGY